ncbi:MAG: hypothetical protein AB1631_11075 [Acidobacteriota bacterium]
MQERSTRRQFLGRAGEAIILSAFTGSDCFGLDSQAASPQDPAYRSGRRSLCRKNPPPGKPLRAHKTDTGIQATDHRAERIITFIADASRLKGGDLELCSEYGRIEVMDSDDGQARLQILLSAAGEGAAKAIEDTDVRAHLTADNGMLRVSVWHETQGFTPQSQPCWVSIRLQVPLANQYKLDAMANHGCVGVHRLTLAGCKLRGLVGIKVKGIKGYHGGHDLHNVVLSGDLDVSTEGPSDFGDAWIHATLRAISSCKVQARANGGNIWLSFTPDSRTGLNVIGRSEEGMVLVRIGEDATAPPLSQARSELRARSKGYESKPVQIEATATSSHGDVTVVMI